MGIGRTGGGRTGGGRTGGERADDGLMGARQAAHIRTRSLMSAAFALVSAINL